MTGLRGAERRRMNWRARAGVKPSCPLRPGAIPAHCLSRKGVRIEIMVLGLLGPHLEAASIVARLRYDARVMAPGGKEIGDLGVAQEMDFIGRSPWRDMVANRAYSEDRNANIGERNGLACGYEAPLGKIVVKERSDANT